MPGCVDHRVLRWIGRNFCCVAERIKRYARNVLIQHPYPASGGAQFVPPRAGVRVRQHRVGPYFRRLRPGSRHQHVGCGQFCARRLELHREPCDGHHVQCDAHRPERGAQLHRHSLRRSERHRKHPLDRRNPRPAAERRRHPSQHYDGRRRGSARVGARRRGTGSRSSRYVLCARQRA